MCLCFCIRLSFFVIIIGQNFGSFQPQIQPRLVRRRPQNAQHAFNAQPGRKRQILQRGLARLQFGQINWTLNGWAIFRGKVEFELKSGSAKQPQLPLLQSNASFGVGGASLEKTLVKMPVAQVLPLMDLP